MFGKYNKILALLSQVLLMNFFLSQHVKAFINETWLERYGYPIQQDNLLFLWSITVSIFGIGGLLGSSGSRYLTVKFGKYVCLKASCQLKFSLRKL